MWKGRDLPQYVTVVGGSASATEADSNDRIFESGRTYLVFPHNRTSPFTDDRCTATRLYDAPTGKAIPANLKAAVGADQARVPVAAPGDNVALDGSKMGPWIIGMGLLLLGLAVGVGLHEAHPRRRRPCLGPAPGTNRQREGGARRGGRGRERTAPNADHSRRIPISQERYGADPHRGGPLRTVPTLGARQCPQDDLPGAKAPQVGRSLPRSR